MSDYPSVFDQSTFKGQSSEELTSYLLRCINALSDIKTTMRQRRDKLKDLKPLHVSDTPQLVSEVSELKSKFDDFVTNVLKPVAYAAAVVAKLPQPQSNTMNNVNIRREVKQASDDI